MSNTKKNETPVVETPVVETPVVETPTDTKIEETRTYTLVGTRNSGKIGCYESAGLSAVVTINLSSFSAKFPTTLSITAVGFKVPKVSKPSKPVIELTPEQAADERKKLEAKKAKLEAKLARLTSTVPNGAEVIA